MKSISDSSLIVCSIVRDAERGLRRNIPVVSTLCKHFANYKVVVYENDSNDNTKSLLKEWMNSEKEHVVALLGDSGAPKSIPLAGDDEIGHANPFFSRKRIERMSTLRNQYLEYVEEHGWEADYLMVVDLDVANLRLEPILMSFAADAPQWDAVTAFGYSTSPKLRKRYHDSYALTEYGWENYPQTESKIKSLSEKYGFLKPRDEWVRVYSAFGGLAIYRFECIKGLRYEALCNDDDRVEVRCEHFSLYQRMAEKGFDKVYINPSMVLKYQDLTLGIIWKSIMRKFRNLKYILNIGLQ